ncbi:MAG: hypothetical protein ACPIOQ_21165 [Promethearchaeia archaeon]
MKPYRVEAFYAGRTPLKVDYRERAVAVGRIAATVKPANVFAHISFAFIPMFWFPRLHSCGGKRCRHGMRMRMPPFLRLGGGQHTTAM